MNRQPPNKDKWEPNYQRAEGNGRSHYELRSPDGRITYAETLDDLEAAYQVAVDSGEWRQTGMIRVDPDGTFHPLTGEAMVRLTINTGLADPDPEGGDG